MMNLIKMIVWGKVVLLTPSDVDIGSHTEVYFNGGPVKALTSEVSIQIHVPDQDGNVVSRIESLKLAFPQGTMRAYLVSTDGERVVLDVQSESVTSEDSRISLSASSGVPVNLKFSKVIIHSEVEIKGAMVYWRNYQH